MNPISSSPIGWVGTNPGETEASIAITITTKDILQRIVGPCVIT